MRSSVERNSLLKILADLFPGRERVRLGWVLAMSTLAAFAEVIGVASILPFMALVLDPAAITKYPAILSIARAFGAKTTVDAIVVLGIGIVLIVAAGNAVSALNVFVQERFAALTKARLATVLFEGYLRQPMGFHVRRDAPSLLKVVLNDTLLVMGAVISPILLSVSRGILAIATLLLLVAQNPLLALLVGTVLCSTYLGVFYMIRTRERRIARECDYFNLERQRISQEGLGGVKELQVLGREQPTIERFAVAARRAALAESSSRIAGLLPRHVLEAVTFGGILLMTLFLLTRSGQSAPTVIPVLALYAFAGYRLLPALQQVFSAAVSVRFNLPVLRGLHHDLVTVQLPERPVAEVPNEVADIHLRRELRVTDVSFSYDGASCRALDRIDLVIPAKQSIGLVGRTGAGKTTLADLILGLYPPDVGVIEVDGTKLLGPSLARWRNRVGYVPQSVFLANATIAQNIAFGLRQEEIDPVAYREAARLAQAEEFIDALPEGFATIVGERGVKLSGGQRQRLGIARALYHQPEVLVFDEATSALDGLTENAVMDAIGALRGHRTVILIAHRLKTVQACDRIIMLQAGKIVADGSYDYLLTDSKIFREFVGAPTADADIKT